MLLVLHLHHQLTKDQVSSHVILLFKCLQILQFTAIVLHAIYNALLSLFSTFSSTIVRDVLTTFLILLLLLFNI